MNQRYKAKVHFDEIDTTNWAERFTVSTPNGIDDAWALAEREADARAIRFGHRHEYTLWLELDGGAE